MFPEVGHQVSFENENQECQKPSLNVKFVYLKNDACDISARGQALKSMRTRQNIHCFRRYKGITGFYF